MSHTPHELSEEFPHAKDKIHTLKTTSPHFANLAERYHEVNRAIHRYETRVEPVDERPERGLRVQRMLLKDEIAAMLRR
ncbi:MAG: DUF465 domain-containing protein [Henriciella sp.]|nr:DUF465 domain-containing protein [Henriciella sp.]